MFGAARITLDRFLRASFHCVLLQVAIAAAVMELDEGAWLVTLLRRYFADAGSQAAPSDPSLSGVVVEAREIHRV